MVPSLVIAALRNAEAGSPDLLRRGRSLLRPVRCRHRSGVRPGALV
jgi:hypothetical protein